MLPNMQNTRILIKLMDEILDKQPMTVEVPESLHRRLFDPLKTIWLSEYLAEGLLLELPRVEQGGDSVSKIGGEVF